MATHTFEIVLHRDGDDMFPEDVAQAATQAAVDAVREQLPPDCRLLRPAEAG